MADPNDKSLSFFAELKRCRVVRVAIVYAVVAFTVWQVAEIAFPALGIPGWAMSVVVVLSILGFPVVLVLAGRLISLPRGYRGRAESRRPLSQLRPPRLELVCAGQSGEVRWSFS